VEKEEDVEAPTQKASEEDALAKEA